MKGWTNAHRKTRRKCFGQQLPKRDFARLKLINRYAASEDCPRVARERIYNLKDLLMQKFGRVVGLVLQHWTTGYCDWDDDDHYVRDCCHHYHVLRCVRIGGKILHRPTGHFKFVNDETEYYKVTVGYEEMADKCTQRIEGRKSEQMKSVPDKAEAAQAYAQLMRRYRHLWTQSCNWPTEPQLQVRKGNYCHEEEMRFRTPSGLIRRPGRNGFGKAANEHREQLKDFQCHWCHATKPGIEQHEVAGHLICDTCRPKLAVV
jgi:hypothetical protein